MNDALEAVSPHRFGCVGRWEGMDRQDARDARGLEEPAGEVDAVASSVLQACVEVHRVLGPGFFESIDELALDLGPWAKCGPTFFAPRSP